MFRPPLDPASRVSRPPGRRAERWPSGLRRWFAKPVYWVTDTEGSNPSLSAITFIVVVRPYRATHRKS
jgi:hypothetical protein